MKLFDKKATLCLTNIRESRVLNQFSTRFLWILTKSDGIIQQGLKLIRLLDKQGSEILKLFCTAETFREAFNLE